MNVLFVFSLQRYRSVKRPIAERRLIPLGISYISALLKGHGHDTELLVLTRETDRRIIDEYIEKHRPGLICFTAVTSEYDFIADVARYIKSKFPAIHLLVGGPHASLNPEAVIRDSFDSLCIGEGEHPTLELVEQLTRGEKPTGIKNLWIKDGDRIEKNPTRAFLDNQDSLPFPDRTLWKDWIDDTDAMQVILLGRGCPFECTYCCNHSLKELAPGQYVRLRSVDAVIDELRHVVSESPHTNEVYFEIETIGINNAFAHELCSALERFNQESEKKLTFGVNLRITPNVDYDTLFSAFANANFRFINIGLESGSTRVREKVLNRRYSNDDIIDTVTLAKKHGLSVYVFAMVGVPTETLEDFKETIACCRTCQPDCVWLYIFFPYPGTDLHQYCMEHDLLPPTINPEMERFKAVLDLPGFSRSQIQRQFNWFFYKVYAGHRSLLFRLGSVLYLKAHSNYTLCRLFHKFTNNKLLKKMEKQVAAHYSLKK